MRGLKEVVRRSWKETVERTKREEEVRHFHAV
jgi:hypothetical protein